MRTPHITIFSPMFSPMLLLSLLGCDKTELPPPPDAVSDTATTGATDSSTLTDSGAVDTETTDTATTETTETTDPACEGVTEVTWDDWGDGFFATWCRSCHSASTTERNGAPTGMDFDTEDQVIDTLELIRWSVLEEERMPLGGGLYDETLALLEAYLDCGVGTGTDGEDVSESVPDADFNANQLESALQEVLDYGLPDAVIYRDLYQAMFEGADENCPGFQDYNLPGNFTGCGSIYGWHYAGPTTYTESTTDTVYEVTIDADSTIIDASGQLYVGGGHIKLTVTSGTDADTDINWDSNVWGTFGYEGSEGVTGYIAGLYLWSEGTVVSGHASVDFYGTLRAGEHEVYYKNLRFDSTCDGLPTSGALHYRSSKHWWYEVALREDCSGCGDAVWADGSELGEVCLDFGDIEAEHVERMSHP